MKNQIKALFLSLIIVATFGTVVSCSNDNEPKVKNGTALKLREVQKLKQYLSGAYVTQAANKTLASYNFSNVILSSYNFNDIKVYGTGNYKYIVINANDFNVSNSSNKAITLGYESVGDFYGEPLIINTISSATLKTVKILSIDNELYDTIDFDDTKHTANHVYTNSAAGKNCGSAVAHCMADAYTDVGWWSVAGAITTAFVPETTLLVAATCYRLNCK